MDEQPVLTGERVTLRPWRPDDRAALYRAGQDPEIHHRTPMPAPFSEAQAGDYVDRIAPGTWEQGGAAFAVVDADGVLRGSMGTMPIRDGVAHVGYWVVPDSRGRGLARAALTLITGWLIDEREVVRVELLIEPDNAASERVAEVCGFHFEGCLRDRSVLHGRRVSMNVWSRLPRDARP